ncbi:hypothetical protein [Streptomyces tibetensis]|uniref:hypothetical protein n=1 Tax=Streptomyces tibetensis TaxID=2382123 RepID=UPI0033F09F00
MRHGGEPDLSADEEWLTTMVRQAVGEVPRRLQTEVANWAAPDATPRRRPPPGPDMRET